MLVVFECELVLKWWSMLKENEFIIGRMYKTYVFMVEIYNQKWITHFCFSYTFLTLCKISVSLIHWTSWGILGQKTIKITAVYITIVDCIIEGFNALCLVYANISEKHFLAIKLQE